MISFKKSRTCLIIYKNKNSELFLKVKYLFPFNYETINLINEMQLKKLQNIQDELNYKNVSLAFYPEKELKQFILILFFNLS